MTLCDASPLIAMLDRSDPDHKACVDASKKLALPLVTTWCAMTETMHLVGRKLGWHGQEKLLAKMLTGAVVVEHLAADCWPRIDELMRKYRDRPMDLGDASLVVLAEQLDTDRIFTLDDDFRVYRVRGRRPFRIVP